MPRRILADAIRTPDAVARIVGWYRRATREEFEDGRKWYPRARHIARTLAAFHSTDAARAAGVIAALSPQVNWVRNLELARDHLAGDPGGHYATQVEKAETILDDETPGRIGRILSGPKTRAFWNCIRAPYRARVACIDRHAVRAAAGDGFPHPDKLTRGPNYYRVAGWYSDAARQLGRPVSEVQAVVWIVYRARHAGRDGAGITDNWDDILAEFTAAPF